MAAQAAPAPPDANPAGGAFRSIDPMMLPQDLALGLGLCAADIVVTPLDPTAAMPRLSPHRRAAAAQLSASAEEVFASLVDPTPKGVASLATPSAGMPDWAAGSTSDDGVTTATLRRLLEEGCKPTGVGGAAGKALHPTCEDMPPSDDDWMPPSLCAPSQCPVQHNARCDAADSVSNASSLPGPPTSSSSGRREALGSRSGSRGSHHRSNGPAMDVPSKPRTVRGIQPGAIVTVMSDFTSSNKDDPVSLHLGQQGTVLRVNERGSVYVDFVGVAKKQWVGRNNVAKLQSDPLQPSIAVSPTLKNCDPNTSQRAKKADSTRRGSTLSNPSAKSGRSAQETTSSGASSGPRPVSERRTKSTRRRRSGRLVCNMRGMGGLMHNLYWKDRWVEVSGGVLRVYRKEGDSKPKYALPISEIQAVGPTRQNVGGREFCFAVVTRDQIYCMQGRNTEHCLQWCEFFSHLLSEQADSQRKKGLTQELLDSLIPSEAPKSPTVPLPAQVDPTSPITVPGSGLSFGASARSETDTAPPVQQLPPGAVTTPAIEEGGGTRPRQGSGIDGGRRNPLHAPSGAAAGDATTVTSPKLPPATVAVDDGYVSC